MGLPDPSPAGEERRRNKRLPAHCDVRLTLNGAALRGRAENISRDDVLFFTRDDVPVTIEVEEDGVVKRAPGRIVRLERLPGGGVGWAVEFG